MAKAAYDSSVTFKNISSKVESCSFIFLSLFPSLLLFPGNITTLFPESNHIIFNTLPSFIFYVTLFS